MPGKSHRTGISLIELAEMFPDEQSAVAWFESIMWPDKRVCPHCGSTETSEASHKKMPYWCKDCRSYFSVKTGSALESSKLPMRKWAFAIYLYVTNIKGISSMRLHRELGVTQKTAWFMLHRLREGWVEAGLPPMAGPVEVDETYIGGKEKNKHARKKLHASKGGAGKKAVAGIFDRSTGEVRAEVVEHTDKPTLHGLVNRHVRSGAIIYTDDNPSYGGVRNRHYSVCHSAEQYVNGEAHTNGIESFWSLLKRGYYGTFHHLSEKHLQRYVAEFAGRKSVREHDTDDQMHHLVASLAGKQLLYRDLVN